MIALASVLSELKFEMPYGGSITIFSAVPILMSSYRNGTKCGLLTAFTYSLIQLFLGFKNVLYCTTLGAQFGCILLDYVLAFTVLGVATFFRKMKGGLYLGATVACVCRFLVHFISGVTIYRINEPTELFNSIYTNPWLYSAVYNGSYVLIDLVLCLVILAVLSTPMRKYLRGDDLKAMQGK